MNKWKKLSKKDMREMYLDFNDIKYIDMHLTLKELYYIEYGDHKYAWGKYNLFWVSATSSIDIFLHHAPMFSYDEWEEINEKRLPKDVKKTNLYLIEKI